MKSAVILAGIGVCGFAPGALAQASLPYGYYEISGTVTSMSGAACPLTTKLPVSGHIYYPGVGHETTQIVLVSVALGKAVTLAHMSAFPPVPAGGLSAWSGSNTVSPNYVQYQNGKLTGGGTAAILAFDLAYNADPMLAMAQGTLSINVDSIGPCTETVQAVFTRIAPFAESKD